MTTKINYLYTDESKQLQIPYKEYEELLQQVDCARRCRELRDQVMGDLSAVLGQDVPVPVAPVKQEPVVAVKHEPIAVVKEEPAAKKEELAEPEKATPAVEPNPVQAEEPPAPVTAPEEQPVSIPEVSVEKKAAANLPPIKADIAAHLNSADDSGRIFNIFKQYYTCINESCGGIVRVTLKDGICSLWNYDAWEEFAFVDILDGRLRIGVDARFTDELKSQALCEVPRLLARQHNLVCVQVDDLSQRVLDVLVKAFTEVEAAV